MIKRAIGIIGCGNMGGAIARGIASKGTISSGEVYVYDKDQDKAAKLAKETACRHGDILQMIRGSEILIIAVKPVDFPSLAELISADTVDQIITSVMAGVRISEIISRFGKSVPVVRAMPNLAACLGRSVTALACNEEAQKNGVVDKIKDIFKCIGDVVEVNESKMDIVTAISGSGPAYLFSLAEAMIEASVKEGLSEEVSRKLVLGTLSGSSELLMTSEHSASELVKMVASKGGTTEAALSVFAENGFKLTIQKAILRAKARSSEMSGGKR